jgi:hypothetical protein
MLLISTTLIVFLGSCGTDTTRAPLDTPAKDGFSLTLPDKHKLSNFCGDQAPEMEEDPTPPFSFQDSTLESKLTGDGLVGWMHGVVARYNHYIFTYRSEDQTDPMRFFKNEHFSLVPATQEVAKALAGLHRHDEVRLKGKLNTNIGPFRHIVIEQVTIVKAYKQTPENAYTFDMKSLKGTDSLKVFGKVHATVHSDRMGHAFVLEHKDFMMPIIVSPQHNEVAAALFRNDKVEVSLKVVTSDNPKRPPHFVTAPTNPTAIKMIDTVFNCHNQEATLDGFLVKFDKSPQINRDIYAVRIVDPNGIGRNFTFFADVSMADPEGFMKLFEELSAKADKAWTESKQEQQNVRNFYKKPSIRVKVAGRMSNVSPSQANPQIYIKSAEDLIITQE